jgi:hypothetical protein
MTLTDAQIRGLLEMEAGASPAPWSQANRWVRCSSHLVASVEGPWGIWDKDQSLIIDARNHLRALCEEVLRLRACESEARTIDLTSLPKREPRFTFTDGPFNDGDGE